MAAAKLRSRGSCAGKVDGWSHFLAMSTCSSGLCTVSKISKLSPFIHKCVACCMPVAAALCERFLRPPAPGSAPTKQMFYPSGRYASNSCDKSANSAARVNSCGKKSSRTYGWKGHASFSPDQKSIPVTDIYLIAKYRPTKIRRATGTAKALPTAFRLRFRIC